VGTALAWAQHQAGVPVAQLVVRGPATAEQRRLARDIGARLARFAEWQPAGLVWLCVPDDTLAAAAKQIAERGCATGETVFLHTSGARSYRELAPLKQAGAEIGAAHPFRSFPRPERSDLAGTYFGIQGDRAAQLVATRMVKRMGGVPFALKAKDKALYHAFGSFASPLLIALLAAGAEAGERAGVPPEIVPQLLASLAGGTFANWQRTGAASSFSGPIARGDIETVRLHLTSLAAMPELERIYRSLAEYAAARLPARHRAQVQYLLRQDGAGSHQAGPA
jgi:predicted short-subunit dehydrogenase-like oxidoreductase (DUF2520 family)